MGLSPSSLVRVKEAFSPLKLSKSSGYDNVNFNIGKLCFGFKFMFETSLKSGLFQSNLRIARVIPLFKCGDPKNVSNYRAISVLLCFSRTHTRSHYVYLSNNHEKILYTK